jgi:hypothetical protein
MQEQSVFPDLNDLIAFFGCEPKLLDADVPWFVNSFTFETERTGVVVRAVFEPAEGFIDVSLSVGGHEIAAGQVRALGDVLLHENAGRQTLAVAFGERSESMLWLTLTPQVRLAVEGRDGLLP